jgi:DNA-binding response OmpR family regulator
MRERILIVDDDRHVREILERYVSDAGYEPACAPTATAAAELAARWRPELIVLDLRLPDASGMEAFERLRAVTSAPVIMLTADDEEVQRVLGLELGADDYVTKPFSPREVVARIRTVLRRLRGPAAAEGVLRAGDLEIDRESHDVRVGGRAVVLTPTEYRILELLPAGPDASLRGPSFWTRSTPTPASTTARSTSTSPTCAARSSRIRHRRATFKPSTVWATSCAKI